VNNTGAAEDIIWAIFYLIEGSKECLEELMDIINQKYIVNLISSNNETMQAVALRIIGEACIASNVYAQDFIAVDCLSSLQEIIKSPNSNNKNFACLVLGNIAIGNTAQIQMLINKGVIKDTINLIERTSDNSIREEAFHIIANACVEGNDMQVWQLVSQGVLKVLVQMLGSKNLSILLKALKVVERLLKMDESDDRMAVQWQDIGGVEAMEKLEEHCSGEVYEEVVRILNAYYTVEESEQGLIND